MHRLLSNVSDQGVGSRYLIQHSAGSGKSNSIAWLARQLIDLQQDGENIFDSTIIVTDRVVLDNQISETVRQFTQVGSTVGHAESSADLRQLITEGKRIIITTVQKFPLIAAAMAQEHLDRPHGMGPQYHAKRLTQDSTQEANQEILATIAKALDTIGIRPTVKGTTVTSPSGTIKITIQAEQKTPS